MLANSQAVELGSQDDLQTPFFSGTGRALIFSTDNPFLTDHARTILTDNGLEDFYYTVSIVIS